MDQRFKYKNMKNCEYFCNLEKRNVILNIIDKKT